MSDKIFLHHDGALGDVLLSLPTIDFIRDSSIIHLSTRYDIGTFLSRVGFVEEISDVGGALYLSLYSEKAEVDDKLRKFLSQFKKAYVFSITKPSFLAAKIRTVIPFTFEIKTIPTYPYEINVAFFRLKQLLEDKQLRSIKDDFIFPYSYATKFIRISDDCLNNVANILKDLGYDSKNLLLSLHPGSGDLRKCWKLTNFLELIERLQDLTNLFVVIFTGYAESDKMKSEIDDFVKNRDRSIHLSNIELTYVASFLKYSQFYIGNDSGISHLASLLCPKVFVIFGLTNPVLWRPPYANVEVIKLDFKDNFSKSSQLSEVESVLKAILGYLRV
ncbi:MAG: hypothetical protein N3A59_03990 [Thermodesulfovibrionales bacterium]|nr:hypothetical protein [Thermodesulfovibrionales bacterium]